jgi:hypothetical protein
LFGFTSVPRRYVIEKLNRSFASNSVKQTQRKSGGNIVYFGSQTLL